MFRPVNVPAYSTATRLRSHRAGSAARPCPSTISGLLSARRSHPRSLKSRLTTAHHEAVAAMHAADARVPVVGLITMPTLRTTADFE